MGTFTVLPGAAETEGGAGIGDGTADPGAYTVIESAAAEETRNPTVISTARTVLRMMIILLKL
jgi:hypothetical protein